MAIQKSQAVVLRRQDLRETSLILTFYTKDFGKIKGIVRGVRGSRAQLGGGSLEIFAHDAIVFYERRANELYTISQYDLSDYFSPIRNSIEKLSYAAYMVELLDSVTTLADANPGVFELLLNSLILMSGEASARRVGRIFEIKLLSLLGIMPSLEYCANCGFSFAKASEKSRRSLGEGGRGIGADVRFSLRQGGLICKRCLRSDMAGMPILAGTVKFMEHARTLAFDKIARIKVAAKVGKELEHILRKFLDYHIERRLKTVDFIKEIER